MDGLLLDSEQLALDAFLATCSKFNLGDLSNVFNKCIGTNSELVDATLKEGLNGIMDHKKFYLTWESLYTDLTKDKPIPLKKGAIYLLDHISSMGIPMAVATSTKTARARSKLNSSGILGYFSVIVGGDQVANSKPNPEVYLKVASALSMNPAHCLALEDSSNGVKSALAAKMIVIQIPDLIQPDEALLKMGHIVLDSLFDVASYEFKS